MGVIMEIGRELNNYSFKDCLKINQYYFYLQNHFKIF
jgi:hypothetical protein